MGGRKIIRDSLTGLYSRGMTCPRRYIVGIFQTVWRHELGYERGQLVMITSKHKIL